MKHVKLKINTKTQQYPILIGINLISGISNILKKNSINFHKCLLIIDKNVPSKFIFQIRKSLRNKKIYTKLILYFIDSKQLDIS